jgi:hypothetical protein
MSSIAERLVQLNNYRNLEYTLAAIVERILEQDRKRRQVAEVLRGLKERIDLAQIDEAEHKEIMEPRFVTAVDQADLTDMMVMGVDGGMLSRVLHGLDLILVRAIATIFRYHEGELSEVEYYPSELPPPRLISLAEPLDTRELELVIGMERQLTELKLATEALKTHGGDLLLLDGSIVPQYVDRPPQKSKILELYRELVATFSNLYNMCTKSEVLLAGVVKDSRSARFIDIFQRKILPSLIENCNIPPEHVSVLTDGDFLSCSRDTVFLNHMLEVGERTFAFTYTGTPSGYPLRDLSERFQRIQVFYIKTVPYDRPLRIEFLQSKDERVADRLASLIYALSAHHNAYGLPSVLIEADVRARLAEEELDILHDSIADRIGPSTLLDLRRHRRPF